MNTPKAIVHERFLYPVQEAARLLAISRSYLYEQMRAGRIKYVKQGGATRISAKAINEYVELLITESEVRYDQTA